MQCKWRWKFRFCFFGTWIFFQIILSRHWFDLWMCNWCMGRPTVFVCIAFLLWLISIPACGWFYIILFIPPSVEGHLSCFQLWAIRDVAAINIHIKVSVLLLFSCLVLSDSLRPHEHEHTRLSCPLLSPWFAQTLCPLSQCCHPTISSSVAPFSSYPQSFPASGSFQMSRPT